MPSIILSALPQRCDVAMLIDSGADVTLIPKSAASSLDLVGTGQKYELVAFDGTSNQHESVQADLVFLKRRFRGRICSLTPRLALSAATF